MNYYPGDGVVIGRIESRRLEAPGTYAEPERCPGCDLELEDCENGCRGGCVRCAICNAAGKCEYSDCGAEDMPADWEAQKARAEDHHLEEGRDADRGLD